MTPTPNNLDWLDDVIDEVVQFVDHSNDPQYLQANYGNKHLRDVISEAKATITKHLQEEIVKARIDELSLACRNWEQNPRKPATYMIDRTNRIKAHLTSQKEGK